MVSFSVKVDLPKQPFATKKWLDEIARVQRQTSVPRLRKLFQQTVYGWSNKPDFGWAQKRTSSEMSITMYPQGPYADIWNLVSAGSPPHPIPKSGTTFMRFKKGYRSATVPGSLMSRRAYRSNPVWTAFSVDHPGFEPRNFPELIAREYENPYIGDIQGAINTVAKT